MATETTYDLAVLGGGPAGYTCAIRAAQLGLKVALIEKTDKLGGTCLHWGCIPTKSLLFAAEIWDHLKAASTLGIENVDKPSLNWDNLIKRKNDVSLKHAKGLDFLMKKNKITVVHGHGRLTSPASAGVFTVQITDEDKGKPRDLQAEGFTQQAKTEVKAKKVVLAMGSDARMLPGYEADDTILTNMQILTLPKMPKSLVVIGSGAVGVEFASIFKSFGAEVTILEALPRIVPVEDEEVSKELTRQYKKRGIEVNTGCKVEKIEKNKSGAKVSWTDGSGKAQSKEAEKVLVAVGRAPRTYDAGLDKVNLQLDRGFVTVNEWMETTVPGLYAIGDIVAGLPQLAHVGAMCGIVVASKLAGKYARAVRKDRVPGCTYCDPQIGSVGLTEAQAKEKGYQVKVGKFPFVGNSKATIVDAHDGFVKIVSDAKYGEILGVHIIGPQATELIAEAVTAMELESTVEEMMFTIHAHPTLYEALLDGFASVEGMAINV
ncbi:MAG TPA: dihydrolipoyl dehydrogenase [Candidatus Aquilonibacter sp.]|nr:dihydrolipoyl dehydrogenase [Candidatus Aquilonibacter sp.]